MGENVQIQEVNETDLSVIAGSSIKSLSGQVSKLKYTNARRFLWILVAMLLAAIASRYFIVFVNIFTAGIAGFSQGVVYTTLQAIGLEESNPEAYLVWKNMGYYFVNLFINGFICWWTVKKFGKSFAFWSLSALIISMGFAFALSYTPGFNVAGFIPGFEAVYYVEDTSDPNYWYPIAITYVVTLISATLGGILSGISTGTLFKIGVSGLGFDPIGKYLAREKNISVQKALLMFSMVNSLMWILIQDSIAGHITSFATFITACFSARFVGTIIFLIVNSLVIGKVYPAGKKVVVEVNTEHGIELSNKLNELNWHRPHSIFTVVGGRTRKTREVVRAVILAEEMYDFFEIVSEFDDKAFVAAHQALTIYGNFDTKKRFSIPPEIEQAKKKNNTSNKTSSKPNNKSNTNNKTK